MGRQSRNASTASTGSEGSGGTADAAATSGSARAHRGGPPRQTMKVEEFTMSEMTDDTHLWFGCVPLLGWICAVPNCLCCCRHTACRRCESCGCGACCACSCCDPTRRLNHEIRGIVRDYNVIKYKYRTCNYCIPLCIGRCCANHRYGNDIVDAYVAAVRSGMPRNLGK